MNETLVERVEAHGAGRGTLPRDIGLESRRGSGFGFRLQVTRAPHPFIADEFAHVVVDSIGSSVRTFFASGVELHRLEGRPDQPEPPPTNKPSSRIRRRAIRKAVPVVDVNPSMPHLSQQSSGDQAGAHALAPESKDVPSPPRTEPAHPPPTTTISGFFSFR